MMNPALPHDLPTRTNLCRGASATEQARDVVSEATALRRWLFMDALPLWWDVGADRVHGGFHEAIDLDGRPMPRPRRARSIARMAFAYCEAGRLGWNGPWREAAQHALDYFLRHFVAADATIASVVELDGGIGDPSFDLYNQAFALLAYASGQRAFGEAAGWRGRAVALRTTLERANAHPLGGFREDGRLPQCANPHMHLLEAALAWIAIDDNPAWRRMADGIALLCLQKFIDPASGALREFFDADWSPMPGVEGRICEPGHHYEWAFLLDRWAKLTGRERPEAVSRLVAFADACGRDPRHGVVINAVLVDGTVHDPVARLWAQAERVRAYLADCRPDEQVVAAIKALRRFLSTPTRGIWYDQLAAGDSFVVEPARSTQLYHIVGAVSELSAAVPGIANASIATRPGGAPPRLIFLVTEDWYFMSHRLPMARAARDAGFDVHVATRIDRHGAAIEAEGFHPHPISWRRGSLDPRNFARVVREVRKLYRRIEPDLVHHVALPATVVGSLAATGLAVARLNALTGLGSVLAGRSRKARTIRPAVTALLRALLGRGRSRVLVQNLDDQRAIERLGIASDRIALIPGSGVDIDAMTPLPEPGGTITVAFAARLIEAKGIRTLVAAHGILAGRGRKIRLLIAGEPDPANPGSITSREIAGWLKQPDLDYLGFVEDIREVWAGAHIAALPSHGGEGVPLSLLEAAAVGRPIVTTDTPGCRDIGRHGINALLVPRGDADALADAIDRLAGDPELRLAFARAGRALVEREFSSKRVGRDIVALYRSLLQADR